MNLKRLKKKSIKNIAPAKGFLYINFTRQNSIFTLTNLEKKVIKTISNGSNGFKNSKSKTKFATTDTLEKIAQYAKALKLQNLNLILKGKNKGRRKCTKILQKNGIYILKIIDKSLIIHNGCRPKKTRRL